MNTDYTDLKAKIDNLSDHERALVLAYLSSSVFVSPDGEVAKRLEKAIEYVAILTGSG